MQIITVHGTNAGAPQDAGDQWWQTGSAFQRKLASYLDTSGATVSPFHWKEGPNSETARRNAGKRLYKKIRALDRAGKDYALLGHSHGGSVIHHALHEAATKKNELPRLKAWSTIGTPFVWMRPKRFIFQRLTNLGRVYLILLVSQIITLACSAGMFILYGPSLMRGMVEPFYALDAQGGEYGDNEFTDLMAEEPLFLDGVSVSVILFYVVSITLTLWLVFRSQRRIRRRYQKSVAEFSARAHQKKWVSFRSSDDEAISALRSVTPVKLRPFNRAFLTAPAKNLLMFAYVLFAGLTCFYQVVLVFRYGFTSELVAAQAEATRNFLNFDFIPEGYLTPESLDIVADPGHVLRGLQFTVENPAWGIMILLEGVIGTFLAVYFIRLIFWLLHWLMVIIGAPASAVINGATTNNIKDMAFGNDTLGERVVAIGVAPLEFDSENGRLPQDVDRKIMDHSAAQAAETLHKARSILGLSSEAQGDREIVSALVKQLSWDELIHTSYFSVDEFTRLFAIALSDAGIAPLRAAGWTQAQLDEARAWREQMREV